MTDTPANLPLERDQQSSNSRAIAFDNLLTSAVWLGVFLRILWVGKRELWYDEVLSILLSSGQKNAYQLPDNAPFAVGDIAPLLHIPTGPSAVETVKNLIKGTLGDPHPPLFYLGEHGWMRLFGNSEAALRSLVVIVSLGALVIAYALGRRILGKRGGLIFTALLSLNPFFLAHSLNLRMYTSLTFWALLSGLSLLLLIPTEKFRENSSPDQREIASPPKNPAGATWLLRGLLALSITAGFLTQYLFAYWMFALAALVLYLDRKHWWQHGLTLGAGIFMFMPWALWGVRQQMHNRSDVLNQLSATGGGLAAAIAHTKDLAHTLANHLLLGHLTTGMLPIAESIKPTAVATGCAVIGFLLVCIIGLWRRQQYRVLTIGVLMGLLPLGVALAIDIATNKYTLGFGWGRSTIVALPGCLLLVAAWLEKTTGRWKETLTVMILIAYLVINIGDMGLRDRQIFREISNGHIPETSDPVLVVTNTRAWGHVLRLVYYLDRNYSDQLDFDIDVLATDAADVTAALPTALEQKPYRTVLWLKWEYPLWNAPDTEAELNALSADTEALLQANYDQPTTPRQLKGTRKLDRFELQTYRAR